MRYHKDIGFPTTLKFPDIMVNLGYTTHAKERRKRDNQYYVSRLPNVVPVSEKTILEVHTSDNINIEKALVRVSYTDKKNLGLILKLNLPAKHATVITLWVNKKQDNGRLKTFLYDVPEHLKTLNSTTNA